MAAREVPGKFLVAFSLAGEQRNFVRLIAEVVERRLGWGTVFLDEWFEHYLAGNDADLKLQKIYAEQCELAVLCISKHYGDKPWTKAEHAAIRARLMKLQESKNTGDEHRILPIRVGDGDLQGILLNTIVPDVRTRTTNEAAELILERLRLIVPDIGMKAGPPSPRACWGDTPSTMLDWPMANQGAAREAFALLVAPHTPWRFLPIRGPSETGKSHITRQMLANALRMPDLACGRLDFKGTTDLGAELRAFTQDLGVTVPASSRLNDCLAQILYALRRRAWPALLVFDTYEAVGEAEDWVDRELLPCLIRATWLRVVIVGQRVPSEAGAVWASVARTPLQLTPPPPEDWLAFGQQHKKSDVSLDFVRKAHAYSGGKASLLAQLLGPSDVT
jgi:hypothetical protein